MKWIPFYSFLLLGQLMINHKVNSLLAVSRSWPPHGKPWSEFSSIPLFPLHGHLMVGHEVNSPLFLSTSLPYEFLRWIHFMQSPIHGHLMVGYEVNYPLYLYTSWTIHGSHNVNSRLAVSPSWSPHGRQWSELSSSPFFFLCHDFLRWIHFLQSPLHGHLMVGHEVNSPLLLCLPLMATS